RRLRCAKHVRLLAWRFRYRAVLWPRSLVVLPGLGAWDMVFGISCGHRTLGAVEPPMGPHSSMETFPTVLLTPSEADRIVAGHPWIYHGSVLRLTHPAADGALVQIKDHRQRFVGVGFYNSKSRINVRVLAPERVEIDQAFFEDRIRAALAVRAKHLPKATSFRVVNAESDFLSGLIVDKYEDVLVVQTSSLGMDQRKPTILAALEAIFSPRAIVERNEAHS